jgi:hypothetical protein
VAIFWSDNTTTNQKLAFAVGGILGRVHDLGGTCGADGMKNKNKKSHGLKWLPIDISNATTNQEHVVDISNATTNQEHMVVVEERKARRFDRGGVWGKRDSIVLVAKESGRM